MLLWLVFSHSCNFYNVAIPRGYNTAEREEKKQVILFALFLFSYMKFPQGGRKFGS